MSETDDWLFERADVTWLYLKPQRGQKRDSAFFGTVEDKGFSAAAASSSSPLFVNALWCSITRVSQTFRSLCSLESHLCPLWNIRDSMSLRLGFALIEEDGLISGWVTENTTQKENGTRIIPLNHLCRLWTGKLNEQDPIGSFFLPHNPSSTFLNAWKRTESRQYIT